jgi:zinc finger protein
LNQDLLQAGNVEGILNRIKHQIETAKDNEEDADAKKKAKKLLKKLNKAMWGQEKLKIIIEDPSGNSAIISEKAVKGKLK